MLKALEQKFHSGGYAGLVYGLLFVGLLIFCASQITTQVQLVLGSSILVILFILRFFRDSLFIHTVFLLLGAFLSIDYFFWRTFTTLTFYDPISWTCAMVLYLAEVYGFTVYVLSIFVNISPLDRKPLPLPDDRSDLPSVDVMIPTYNEDLSIIETTMVAALNIRYPKDKLRVYVLDDGGTDQRIMSSDPDKSGSARKRRALLTDLCQKHGGNYITRARNEHAKAGNINNALHQTDGELVLILDADHVPTVDILENTVGWFLKDPKMFLVQTPHFFGNADPIEKNLETFHRMPSENEMFYKVIQKGLDFWNSAFFCGSAAVLRRKCLMEVGGVVGDTITEDAETALSLHARGYNSAYIDRPMITGLSPETLGGFIGQRIRWAQGMIQIFLLKNPLLIRGLTFPQRLCYFSSCFFWFFGFARLVFVLAPMAFLFFGLKIYDANGIDFVAFAVPHLIAGIMVSDYLFGKVRWSFVSELYELIQSVYTLPAIFKVFVNPRAPKFNVTAKGETLSKDFVSPLARPFYIILLLNWVAVLFGAYRFFLEGTHSFATSITMFWAMFNILLLTSALGALLERRQLRHSSRLPADIPSTLVIGQRPIAASIVDLSNGGAAVAIDPAFEALITLDAPIELTAKNPETGEAVHFNIIPRNCRRSGDLLLVGSEFDHQSLEETRQKITFVNGSSRRWIGFQMSRESRIGVMRSLLFLFTAGLRHALSHLAHLLLSGNATSNSEQSRSGTTAKT